MLRIVLTVIAGAIFASSSLAEEYLVDDFSRGQLAEYELLEFGPPADKGVLKRFIFPRDADDAIYGIDVSHHNGQIDWRNINTQLVNLVYIKASQGLNFADRRFQENWRGAGQVSDLRKGAYHFLSARGDGDKQADNFLSRLQLVGGLKSEDLTPVLDLEWDFQRSASGANVDRWSSLTADQIADIALEWLTKVEQVTGRKPIIYTSASWWGPRLGNSRKLDGYAHWIADYRVSSINRGAPVAVRGSRVVAWQFTDIARVGGRNGNFDANRVQTSLDDLSGR